MNTILILVIVAMAVAIGWLFLSRPTKTEAAALGGGSRSGPGLDAGKVGLAALGGALAGAGEALTG